MRLLLRVRILREYARLFSLPLRVRPLSAYRLRTHISYRSSLRLSLRMVVGLRLCLRLRMRLQIRRCYRGMGRHPRHVRHREDILRHHGRMWHVHHWRWRRRRRCDGLVEVVVVIDLIRIRHGQARVVWRRTW